MTSAIPVQRTGLNFFQVLFTTTRFSSVLSCEDLLISSTFIVAFFLVKCEKTPTFKVSHWPFIPTGVLVNGSVTFTPGKLM